MQVAVTSAKIGSVSSEEVAGFRRLGWTVLDNLLDRATVKEILARAISRMGEVPRTVLRHQPEQRVENAYGWYARWDGCSHHDPFIAEVSHSRELATAASRLMGKPVRFYFDHIFAKLPTHSAGRDTPWHQDLPHHPLDRHGALTMWIALVDCPPEMGTMRFLSGSHRAGLFGRFLNREDGVTLVDDHSDVLERFEACSPLELRAGDATVHDLAIIHRAPENATDRIRWVYVCQWLPADARYTGAPNHRTDGLGLMVDRPLDHPHFPLIEID
jgi:ectoine hydroxylase-related dioxygenase (phytanoyl-CoA dioxygenase family)